MNIIQDLVPITRKNRPGRANPMRYITIHNTGNTGKGANARSHANYIKGDTAANIPTSWHYTVDDKEIIQHIPDNEIAWHAGDGNGKGNTESIGIEICMNSDGDLVKATDNAVWLTAILMDKYSIPIENVVQHNKWSGKNCPQMLRQCAPYNWTTFINKVKSSIEQTVDSIIIEVDGKDVYVERMKKVGASGGVTNFIKLRDIVPLVNPDARVGFNDKTGNPIITTNRVV